MGKFIEENLLINCRPDLEELWDFKKNEELGLDFYSLTKESGKRAWWICKECDSNFDTIIADKTNSKRCPYCVGQRVNHTNSLASLNPDLASEWHPVLNGEKTANDVTCKSSARKVWWLGWCGHEWKSKVKSRAKGDGCPYCSGRRVLVGFNDMWTANPEMASLLANPKDGYKYTQGSSTVKVDWECPDCHEVIQNKKILTIKTNGLSCPRCSDGVSYPEKFVFNVLKQLHLNIETEKIFKWSNKKRYDFFLPKQNTIIEVHGGQHYKDGFSRIKGGKTLEEIQENDRYKETLAKENGIEKYIIINAERSIGKRIQSSICNSELLTMFCLDDIDWEDADIKSNKSLVLETFNLKTLDNLKEADIARELGISRQTVMTYLTRCDENKLFI